MLDLQLEVCKTFDPVLRGYIGLTQQGFKALDQLRPQRIIAAAGIAVAKNKNAGGAGILRG
jgi:hypothetical protein